MRRRSINVFLIMLFILLPLILSPSNLGRLVVHAPSTGQPTLAVVSGSYGNNITDTSLTPSRTFRVDVTIANAGRITAIDITLQYGMATQLHSPIQTTKPQVTDQDSGQIFGTSTLPSNCQTVELVRNVYTDPLDTIRIVMGMHGPCDLPGDGILFSVVFNVVGINATSLEIQRAKDGRLQELVIGPSPGFIPVQNLKVVNAYFLNQGDGGVLGKGVAPIANFTSTPTKPKAEDIVKFNATASYDPGHASASDRGIARYIWSWGDLSPALSGDKIIETHEFLIAGSVAGSGWFEVRLVVLDSDDGIPAKQTQLIFIDPGIKHDLAVGISADQTQVTQGATLRVTVTVYNQGNRNENATLDVTYDYSGTSTIGQEPFFSLSPQHNKAFNYTLQTSNLPPRTYTVTANAQLKTVNATDTTPSDDKVTLVIIVDPSVGGNTQLNIAQVAVIGVVALGIVGGATFLVRRRRRMAETAEDALS